MDLSKKNQYIVRAFKEGYDINEKGQLIRKDGSLKSKFRVDEQGYLNVTLRLDSKSSTKCRIHKMQAYKKYGEEMFKKGIVVRHFNGIKDDNSWDNILIGTYSDNQMDIPEEIRIKSATTATRKMQNNIRSYEERCIIYLKLKNGISYKQIMLQHDISKGTLSYMKNHSKEYKEYILI